MSSQYGEHDLILQHFAGRIGRFLDVGAFDGVTFSNTKPLADLGWSGVFVEPSPPAFCHLMRNYADNPRVQLVNAAVVPFADAWPTLLKLHCNTADAQSADMLSTFDASLRDKWAGHPFRPIWTSGTSWHELYAAFGNSFDFVNIDVEGMNLDVLKYMPIDPEMICVEADPPEQIMRVLEDRGYRIKLIGGNVLGWRPQ